MATPVSFTVRRPTPTSRPPSSGPESDGPFKIPALPRHLASAGSSAMGSPLAGSPRTFSSREDSDDDDDETGIVFANGSGADDDIRHTDSSDDEHFVVGAKQLGQRLRQKKKLVDSEAPLVIPTKPNPDWREAAKRRRAACSRVQPYTSRGTPSFVPDSAVAATGADGSVGGLGTRDTINSGPQLSGLQINNRVKVEAEEDGTAEMESTTTVEPIEETEDQRALRAILAGEDESTSAVDIIPVPPLSESDALKQDVEELPDVATADDYERVPISAFGAAMLRGMGWTDGAIASKGAKRRENGLTELYLPQARPALLGIGAKEREPEDDGSGKKKQKGPDMRYVPVARKEGGSSRSGTTSRRGSHSPSRKDRKDRDAERERSGYDHREPRRERDRDRDDESRRRTKDYDDRDHERWDYSDKDRDWEKERDRSRSARDSHRGRERGRHYNQRDERDSRDRRDKR
ncbi:DExH-box splicing factor binding site-domain-containing protein [Chiua virens]|nr:DExH-box splicing factor binding site-domain-containing protein [Chiua virens]